MGNGKPIYQLVTISSSEMGHRDKGEIQTSFQFWNESWWIYSDLVANHKEWREAQKTFIHSISPASAALLKGRQELRIEFDVKI